MNNKTHWLVAAFLCASTLTMPVLAKLAAPSDEAKAKAAEAAAKTAWAGKVDNFKLCKSMEVVATGYFAQAKKGGKEVKPAVATPPCADPGPFVYAPPAPASSPAGVTTAAAPAAPAPAATAVATQPKK